MSEELAQSEAFMREVRQMYPDEQLDAYVAEYDRMRTEIREDRFAGVALHTQLADALGVDPDPESLASLIGKAVAALRATRDD